MALHSEHQGYSAGRLQLQGGEQVIEHLFQDVHQNGEEGEGEGEGRELCSLHLCLSCLQVACFPEQVRLSNFETRSELGLEYSEMVTPLAHVICPLIMLARAHTHTHTHTHTHGMSPTFCITRASFPSSAGPHKPDCPRGTPAGRTPICLESHYAPHEVTHLLAEDRCCAVACCDLYTKHDLFSDNRSL